jgi:GAF domain-containing protein
VALDHHHPDTELLQFLGQQFSDLAGMLASDSADSTDPDRVVRFAVASVPHAAHGDLTLIRGSGRPTTGAATDELPITVDGLQYRVNEGPCLEAATDANVVLAPDLTTEGRWPQFAERCVTETPVRSMLCIRLPMGSTDRAALNLYATQPRTFDDLDVAVASMFAAFAGLAVETTVHARDVANLNAALSSSRQIGTAIGILMAHDKLTALEAFEALRDASNHLNRKARDVAAEVELTGILPESPS